MRRNIIAIGIITVAILFMAVAIAGSTEPVEEYLEAEIQEATEEILAAEDLTDTDITEPTGTDCPDCLQYEQILEDVEAERYTLEQRLDEIAGYMEGINQILEGEADGMDLESEESTATW